MIIGSIIRGVAYAAWQKISGLIAWACVGLIMALFRCFTLLILNRFPSTALPDVEVFAALWVLTQAPYAWRSLSLVRPSTDRRSEDESKKHDPASSPSSASRPAVEGGNDDSMECVNLTKYLVLYPFFGSSQGSPCELRGDQGSRSATPQTQTTQPPGAPFQGPCFQHSSSPSAQAQPPFRCPRVLLWLNLKSAAQRRGVSISTVMAMARAAGMALAVLEMDPLQAAPAMDVVLDHVVEAFKSIMAYYNDDNGLLDSVSQQQDRLVSMEEHPQPLITLGGSALTATVAMLVVARRYPALHQCSGLLLFDPFVGWTSSPASRHVSFHDESVHAATDGDAAAPPTSTTSISGAAAASSPLTPLRVPTKGAVKPSAVVGGVSTAGAAKTSPAAAVNRAGYTSPAKTSTPVGREESLLMCKGFVELLTDAIHDMGHAMRSRFRRDFSTKSLRQWFPAAQWASCGCQLPIFFVLDSVSVWVDDQVEFVTRWQQSGDDIDAFLWTSESPATSQSFVFPVLSPSRWEQLRTLALASRPYRTNSFQASPTVTLQQQQQISPFASEEAAIIEAMCWLLSFRFVGSNNATPAVSLGTPGFWKLSGAAYRPIAQVSGAYGPPLPPMLRAMRRLNSRESICVSDAAPGTGGWYNGGSLPSAESVSDLFTSVRNQ